MVVNPRITPVRRVMVGEFTHADSVEAVHGQLFDIGLRGRLVLSCVIMTCSRCD